MKHHQGLAIEQMNHYKTDPRATEPQSHRAAEQKAVGELQAKGMQFNEIFQSELEKMRQIGKPATDKFLTTNDLAMVKLYNEELAKTRK